ncbi:GGDEF domain-containing protein [Novilysobacter arseniciresistens]|uniref:GGDEF domain-containing protein n=1 Tax=Novilysobacter arseniciresistens TaxID=1385522 RepID=UPI000690AF96|nr:sensor domain-containing diguanylate cyclase [Lysobacter arseniciresistens]
MFQRRPPGAVQPAARREAVPASAATRGDDALADIVRLATLVCGTTAAAIALVDGDRFRLEARIGLVLESVPRGTALSVLALREPGTTVVIEDIAARPGVKAVPIEGGMARFYAGRALCDTEGRPTGVICVFDRARRTLDRHQLEALEILARQAQCMLELDRNARQQQRELSEHRDLARTLEHRATHDTLTGLLNRDALSQLRRNPEALARLDAGPYCLMLLDIDHFKQVNDRHGHLLGDTALRQAAAAVAAAVRADDVAVRFGGEEFLVVLPSTSLSNAAEIAERIRQSVAAIPLPFRLTLSVGVAAGDPARDQPEDVFERADQALYRAKAGGRDRVVVDDTLRLSP